MVVPIMAWTPSTSLAARKAMVATTSSANTIFPPWMFSMLVSTSFIVLTSFWFLVTLIR